MLFSCCLLLHFVVFYIYKCQYTAILGLNFLIENCVIDILICCFYYVDSKWSVLFVCNYIMIIRTIPKTKTRKNETMYRNALIHNTSSDSQDLSLIFSLFLICLVFYSILVGSVQTSSVKPAWGEASDGNQRVQGMLWYWCHNRKWDMYNSVEC